MDDIKALATLVWGYPITRMILMLIVAYGIFMVILCILLEQKRPDGLYSAPEHIRVNEMPLKQIIQGYEASPRNWLLYEEEIFYVKDPDSFTEEQKEYYRDALTRYESGGIPARKVGRRVLIDKREVKNYLRFFKRTLKEN